MFHHRLEMKDSNPISTQRKEKRILLKLEHNYYVTPKYTRSATTPHLISSSIIVWIRDTKKRKEKKKNPVRKKLI